MKRILLVMALCALGFSSLFGASKARTTVGYSFVMLGDEWYNAIEVGTQVRVTTAKGTVRPYAAVEASVPIIFTTNGDNIANTSTKGSGYGVGLTVPLILGLDISGFYIQIMGGYNLNWVTKTLRSFPSGTSGLTSTIKEGKTSTISQGFVYGAGLGFCWDDFISLGVSWITGSMNNDVSSELDLEAISNYKRNYHKVMAYIGFDF